VKFSFNVNLSDSDYFEYNKFWLIRSPYGKKQITLIRVLVSLITAVLFFISLFGGGFTLDALMGTIPLLIFLLLFQVFLNTFVALLIKLQMKLLKKKGKMGYSPSSVIEFYEDCFVETTPENKTEQKYSAVERISIVGNKMYIHVNNVMCYILPFTCFETKGNFEDFLSFIKTKCNKTQLY